MRRNFSSESSYSNFFDALFPFARKVTLFRFWNVLLKVYGSRKRRLLSKNMINALFQEGNAQIQFLQVSMFRTKHWLAHQGISRIRIQRQRSFNCRRHQFSFICVAHPVLFSLVPSGKNHSVWRYHLESQSHIPTNVFFCNGGVNTALSRPFFLLLSVPSPRYCIRFVPFWIFCIAASRCTNHFGPFV